jgi:hypothetical protein
MKWEMEWGGIWSPFSTFAPGGVCLLGMVCPAGLVLTIWKKMTDIIIGHHL